MEEEANGKEASLTKNQEGIVKWLQNDKGFPNIGLKYLLLYSSNLENKDVNRLKMDNLLDEVEYNFPSIIRDST